jgi:predicted GH43/DUF377 family glycosyl hydrolase
MEIQLKRYQNNPILMPTQHIWENKAVYNCGVTIFENRILLLYRAQGDDMISRFGLAFTDDGFHIAERLSHPIFEPDPDSEYETLGVEDPRITKIDDSYYITYAAASLYPNAFGDGPEKRKSGETPWRVRVSLAHTHDFQTFSRHGVVISHIDSKDAVFFPKKINNHFILLHRVHPKIRLVTGDSMDHLQERGPVFGPNDSGWDSDRIGVGATPIKTQFGWILIYHGVQNHVYSLGLALLDPHEPTRVLARSKQPILTPTEPYEKKGLVDSVVFTCGAVQKDDQLFVYYGAADSSIGVATVEYQKILDWAEYHYKAKHHK